MKGLIHKHNVPIYFQPIKICFHRETFEKLAGYKLSRFSTGHACVSDKEEILIYIDKRDNGSVPANTLAHECYHAVDFMLELTGMEHHNGGSNEHCAYLIGHLVDAILDKLEIDNKFELEK